jgi:hypothetical protein
MKCLTSGVMARRTPAFFKKSPSRNLLPMKESLPMKIRDSVALVTGANRGLGLAFAEERLAQLAHFPKKSLPSAVRVTPRGLRRRRSTPISTSKSALVGSNAGCATRSCAAALVNFNASPTARKYRRCRSSILQPHHAEKAWPRHQHGICEIENREVSDGEDI